MLSWCINILDVDSQYVDTKVVNMYTFHHYMSIKTSFTINPLLSYKHDLSYGIHDLSSSTSICPFHLLGEISHFIAIVYICLKLSLFIHSCLIISYHLLNLHHKALSFFMFGVSCEVVCWVVHLIHDALLVDCYIWAKVDICYLELWFGKVVVHGV